MNEKEQSDLNDVKQILRMILYAMNKENMLSQYVDDRDMAAISRLLGD